MTLTFFDPSEMWKLVTSCWLSWVRSNWLTSALPPLPHLPTPLWEHLTGQHTPTDTPIVFSQDTCASVLFFLLNFLPAAMVLNNAAYFCRWHASTGYSVVTLKTSSVVWPDLSPSLSCFPPSLCLRNIIIPSWFFLESLHLNEAYV